MAPAEPLRRETSRAVAHYGVLFNGRGAAVALP